MKIKGLHQPEMDDDKGTGAGPNEDKVEGIVRLKSVLNTTGDP